MKSFTRKSDSSQPAAETAVYLFDDWFDPIEAGVRDRVREFIQAMVEGELDAALMRPRYGRRSQSSGDADGPVGVIGHRHGHRSRSLMGTFGRTEIELPRARLDAPDGKTREWKSKTLRAYQRRTLAADALIASTYLAGTNTRRVRRALAALFGGAVGKDTVSRVWRKVKADWEAWNGRSLAEEPIVRLILDGTVVWVRLDRKAPQYHCLSSSASARTARKYCWRSRTWVERAPRLGVLFSTIWSIAACIARPSSSWTVRRGWKRQSPRFGTAYRFRGVRSISTATYSPTRPTACTTRSPPITPT